MVSILVVTDNNKNEIINFLQELNFNISPTLEIIHLFFKQNVTESLLVARQFSKHYIRLDKAEINKSRKVSNDY